MDKPDLKNPNVKELAQAEPGQVKFDYSRAVHVPCGAFEINVEPTGMVKLALAATTMQSTDAQVQVIAHIPQNLMEPLVNAIGLVANRMGIKIHNTVQ